LSIIQRTVQDESAALKRENDQLHKNMTDVENQLKEIEQTVQTKEEMLLTDLKSKDAILESIHGDNEQLNGELQRLRIEIDRLQLAHEAAINETRELKVQLDERFLATANSPSIVGDDSFEFIKQPSPPPAEIDTRPEQLNELIRSSKEALENQDSIVQQLDKHLNDMHRSGIGETLTSNVDGSTVASTSDQQQTQS
jgi:chromosome segregation ATPase